MYQSKVDNYTKRLFIIEIKIMKLNFLKYFLACALGLMTFSAGQARAGTVIGGQLYSPLSLKLSLTYYDSNGKFKKLAISTKDILLALGYAKNDQLATGPGGDVYVIDNGTVLADLTTSHFLTVNVNQLLYSQTQPNENSAAYSFTESGLLTINFYSDGRVEDPSGHGSDLWFEVSGTYTGSGQVSATKNNQQTIQHNIKSQALTGGGYDSNVASANPNNPSPLPATGNASASGSGKVLVAE